MYLRLLWKEQNLAAGKLETVMLNCHVSMIYSVTLCIQPGLVGPGGLYVANSCSPSFNPKWNKVVSGATSTLNMFGYKEYNDSLS